MTGIAPGAYVRVTRGMYRGTEGRVVSLHAMESTAPYVTVDVGDVCVGVSAGALELVGAVSTTEQERDAAIAERDRLRAEVADLLPEADAKQHFATRALRAEERFERLRREVEALRDSLRTNLAWGHSEDVDAFWHELDVILRGES